MTQCLQIIADGNSKETLLIRRDAIIYLKWPKIAVAYIRFFISAGYTEKLLLIYLKRLSVKMCKSLTMLYVEYFLIQCSVLCSF